MVKILMSDFKHYHKENDIKVANAMDNSNGIVDQIKDNLKNTKSILFVASSPADKEKTNEYAKLLFDAMKLSGITFENYIILYDENEKEITSYIESADMIYLAGGSTYTQNKFFETINLRELLNDFDGLLIGQSAGAINMAEDAFNSPEYLEDSEPIHFKGLGVTEINVEPHFVFDDKNFDEAEKYQRNIIMEESYKHDVYGQCDGSHIIIDGQDNAIICGETYLIRNGEISLICSNGECIKI